MKNPLRKIVFHAGCSGCTQQYKNPIEFCMGCQYFDADWSLPNLNNSPPTEVELIRERLKLLSKKNLIVTPS